MTKIEQVALALAVSAKKAPDDLTGSLLKEGEAIWQQYVIPARAAIEAMREPTEEMLACCQRVDNDEYIGVSEGCARELWNAMIDAAKLDG